MYKLFTILLLSIIMTSTGAFAQEPAFIPKPLSCEMKDGTYSCSQFPGIKTEKAAASAAANTIAYMEEKGLSNIFKINLCADRTSSLPAEGYLLDINPNEIRITAGDAAGFFYGLQTLLQCCPPAVYDFPAKADYNNWQLPCLSIKDYPRFSYRGMMLDVSRQFFSTSFVKKYIDWLSIHKINTFHWHLTDDNGWRVEIKKYPELCNKGAWRGPGEVLPAAYGSGLKRYGGYYTQREIKDIVEYAKRRNITIIPEIDLPGHAKAAMSSYPQWACKGPHSQSIHGETCNVWCVSQESNYRVLEDIIAELVSLFPGPYIHIGGDEVNTQQWKDCESCQALMSANGMKDAMELQHYFVHRMEAIVEKYGKSAIGWNEILKGGALSPNTVVHAWQHEKYAKEATSKGQKCIFEACSYLYFDMKYTPLERGLSWAAILPLDRVYSVDPIKTSGLTDKEAANLLGVQGGLWAEMLDQPSYIAQYQSYPRICALSEIAWTPQEMRDFNDFDNRLCAKHYDRLLSMGIHFRVPIPTVTFNNGYIIAQSPYPWMVIRFTTDETEPNLYSSIYQGPLAIDIKDRPWKYRFSCFYKDRIQSTAIAPQMDHYLIYQRVPTTVEASFPTTPNSPLSLLADFDPKSNVRCSSRLKEGDWLIYTFKEPVSSPKITFATGIPDLDIYLADSAIISCSFDGTTWTEVGKLDNGRCSFSAEEKIKAVKVVFDRGSSIFNTCIQDLLIER